MIVATSTGRGEAVLCEVCAARLAARADTPDGQPSPSAAASVTPALDSFGTDVSAHAREGRIDPVIGRSPEIEQTVEILARRRKNNAVLLGEAGVGKTAIVEGLARRIAEGDVPDTLEDYRVVTLDLSGLLAGAQYRGQFEQRFKAALDEVRAAEGTIVLFIDELHTVLGAGAAEGALDAANMLKPLLARGELRLIGATTLAEYRNVERDAALARRFSPVTVEEPSVEETVAILHGLRAGYEDHHDAAITDEALEAAARLSDRYVSEYRLPDKAIDLVDQAAARVRMRGLSGGEGEVGRRRRELVEAAAAKQAAVDAEAYEQAAELKLRAEALAARLVELGAPVVGGAAESDRLVVGEADVAAVVAVRTGIPAASSSRVSSSA